MPVFLFHAGGDVRISLLLFVLFFGVSIVSNFFHLFMDDRYDYTVQESQIYHRKIMIPNLLQSRAKFIYGPIQKIKNVIPKDEEYEEEKFNTLSKQLFQSVKERLFRKASISNEEEEQPISVYAKLPIWAEIIQSSTQYRPFHQYVYKNNIILAVNNVNSQGYSILIYQLESIHNSTQYSLLKKIDSPFGNNSRIINTFGSNSCVLYLVYNDSHQYILKSICLDSKLQEIEWTTSSRRVTFADIRLQSNSLCITYSREFSEFEFERICHEKSTNQKRSFSGPPVPNYMYNSDEIVSLVDMGNDRIFSMKMKFSSKDPLHYDNINIPIQTYIFELNKETSEWSSRLAKPIYNTAKHLLLKSLHKPLDEFVLQNRQLASVSPNGGLITVSTPFNILVVYTLTKDASLERTVFDYSDFVEKKKSDFIHNDLDRYDTESIYQAISSHLERQVHESEIPITFVSSNNFLAIQYSKSIYLASIESKTTKIIGKIELPVSYSNYVKGGVLHLEGVTSVEWETKEKIIGASFSDENSLIIGFIDGAVIEVPLQGLAGQMYSKSKTLSEDTPSSLTTAFEYLSSKWKLILAIALVVAVFVNNELNIRRRIQLYQQQQQQQQQIPNQ